VAGTELRVEKQYPKFGTALLCRLLVSIAKPKMPKTSLGFSGTSTNTQQRVQWAVSRNCGTQQDGRKQQADDPRRTKDRSGIEQGNQNEGPKNPEYPVDFTHIGLHSKYIC
jgi:hypothetical protein